MPPPSARRRPAAWAAALLLTALLAFAFKGALSGRLFYLRDVSQNHAPMRTVVTQRILGGELPLWDPLHGGGTPLLANPNHLVLHPITLLFLALPFDLAFTLSIVLQFVLLAAGGYLLARRLGVDPPAALLAAAVLALSGPAASLASQQNVLSAFAWLPLALWACTRATTGCRVGRLAAVLAGAVILMTGEAASSLALLILAPLIAVAAPTPSGEERPAGTGAALGVIGGILLLSGLVAAIVLVPAQALLAESSRAAGLARDEAFRWSLDPARLAEIVLPRLFGDPTHLSPGSWWGGGRFAGGFPFLPSIVVGFGPALLALAGLGAGPARRLAIGLGIVGGFFLLLALGPATPLLPVLRRFAPVISQVRYPERFLLGALVPLALLAAFGLDRLMRRRGASRAASLSVGAAGLIFLIATLLVATPHRFDSLLTQVLRLPPALVAGSAMAEIRGGILRSLLWALVDATLVAAVLIALKRGGLRPQAAAWGLTGAIALSLTLASDPARSTAAPGWLHAPSPLKGLLGTGGEAAGARLHHAPRPADIQIWAKSDEQIWGFRFDRFTYALLTGHPDGVSTLLDPATDRMDLRTSASIGARLAGLPVAARARLLRLLGVGYYAAWEPITDESLEPAVVLEELSRPPMRLYRVREPLARFRLVQRMAAPRDSSDPVASLLDADFDADHEVLIDRPGQPAPDLLGRNAPATGGSATPVVAGRLEVLQDDPERVRISVVAPQPEILVVGDAYASGWRALVDGQPAILERANLIFRAVAVGAGRHEVTMEYRPPSLLFGAVTSLLGLALLGLWTARRGASA